MAQEQVIIFDTTLRDGEQAAGAGMTTPEKLEIARQLDHLGVDVIEAGFAASSPGDFEAVATVAREIRRPIIASLARAHPNDVDHAWGALKGAAQPRIHVFLSSSDIHLMHQLRKNREEVMDMAVTMVSRGQGLLRRRGILGDGRLPHRAGISLHHAQSRHRRRSNNHQHPRHRRLLHSGRVRPTVEGTFRRTCRISTRPSSASIA